MAIYSHSKLTRSSIKFFYSLVVCFSEANTYVFSSCDPVNPKEIEKTVPTTNPDPDTCTRKNYQDHLCESEDEEGEVTKESTCKEQTGTYNNICSPGWGFYAEIAPQKLRHRSLRQERSATKVDQYKI